MKKIELINLIDSTGLDKNEFVVLSSSALVLRGIMDNAGDLDIAVTNNGLNHLKNKYDLIKKIKNSNREKDKIRIRLVEEYIRTR